jgi:hypothetical protein
MDLSDISLQVDGPPVQFTLYFFKKIMVVVVQDNFLPYCS